MLEAAYPLIYWPVGIALGACPDSVRRDGE